MFAQSRRAVSQAGSVVRMLTRARFATLRDSLKVQHKPQEKMFTMDVDGSRAFVQYETNKDHIVLLETLVPQELEGRGLGKVMAKDVFKYVADNNLRMKIECSFLNHYLEKHAPEYKKYIAKL